MVCGAASASGDEQRPAAACLANLCSDPHLLSQIAANPATIPALTTLSQSPIKDVQVSHTIELRVATEACAKTAHMREYVSFMYQPVSCCIPPACIVLHPVPLDRQTDRQPAHHIHCYILLTSAARPTSCPTLLPTLPTQPLIAVLITLSRSLI